jgi:hypothetical protein
MIKITYKDIAKLIDKSEASIKGYKQAQPELLKLLLLGAKCKLNNISDDELELFAELKERLENKIEEKQK